MIDLIVLIRKNIALKMSADFCLFASVGKTLVCLCAEIEPSFQFCFRSCPILKISDEARVWLLSASLF